MNRLILEFQNSYGNFTCFIFFISKNGAKVTLFTKIFRKLNHVLTKPLSQKNLSIRNFISNKIDFQNLILVFDLDNTLILRDKAMLNCVENVFNILLTENQKELILKKDMEGYSDRILFCDWLRNFLKISLQPNEIWNLISNNIGYFVSLNKDADLVLNQLKDKYQIALLTNGGTENQQRKILETGLDKYFSEDKIFISGKLELSKPDPLIFKFVTNQFPKTSNFCMIGDRWENDILGAVSFGWQAVHLSSIKEKINLKENEVMRISSLSELLNLLNESN